MTRAGLSTHAFVDGDCPTCITWAKAEHERRTEAYRRDPIGRQWPAYNEPRGCYMRCQGTARGSCSAPLRDPADVDNGRCHDCTLEVLHGVRPVLIADRRGLGMLAALVIAQAFRDLAANPKSADGTARTVGGVESEARLIRSQAEAFLLRDLWTEGNVWRSLTGDALVKHQVLEETRARIRCRNDGHRSSSCRCLFYRDDFAADNARAPFTSRARVDDELVLA